MKKTLVAVSLAVSLLAGSAMAQTAPQASQSGSGQATDMTPSERMAAMQKRMNSGTAPSGQVNPGAPVAPPVSSPATQ